MAGTLVLDTLQNGAGTASTSADNVINGCAKAWVNFNGTTSPGTIRASYNVTSVTKNGTGDYTVNFTNALTDANYAVTTGGGNTAESPPLSGASYGLTSLSTTSFRAYARQGVTFSDLNNIFFAVFR
jgi:hypothetical protein